jgi:hypothetical protein
MMLNIHIYDIPNGYENTALICAGTFSGDYPDRIGVAQGVVYKYGSQSFYSYRTKSGRIVVRGINQNGQ